MTLDINVSGHFVEKGEDFGIPGTGKEQSNKPLASVNRGELGQAVIAFQEKTQVAYLVPADPQVKIKALHYFLPGLYTLRVASTLPMSS